MRYALSLIPLLVLTLTQGCESRPAATAATASAASVATRPLTSTTEPNAATATSAPQNVTESFDSGSKGGYASGEVTLTTGPWLFDEALIGTAEQDRKAGRAAARLRADGRVRMLFDVAGPVATVSVRHAAYGHDAPAQWQLWQSNNGGKSWTQVGTTQTAASGALAQALFVVSQPGAARFELRHVGAEGRINFDDFTILTGADAVVMPDQPTTAPPPPPPAGSPAPVTVAGRADHLALGNPSGARADAAATTNYLLRRPEYVLSYNGQTNTANWVAWHLSQAWKGGAKRSAQFTPDPLLPASFYHVTTRDYTGSGFDRGHLCPSDDRDGSAIENAATFNLTNIVPQAPANNQGPWRELEEYARTLAERGNHLYIVAGPAGQGGEGTKGPATTLAGGKLVVPKWTWKIVVVLPNGATDLRQVKSSTRVIAIQMPNDQSVEHHHWDEYRVSVAQLEKLTGYDFLSTLPKDIQRVLEAKVDDGPTR